MIYNELTRRYFEAPVCAGRLSGARVFRGAAGDPERGTWVQFEVRVGADRLEAVRFAAFACPHVIAVCAWLAEQAQGTLLSASKPDAVAQLDERFALPMAVTELAERFAVPVEKMGRLLIIEDAWSAAIAAAAASTSPAVSTVATSTAATTSAIAASTGITTAGATSIDRRAGG